MMKGPPAVAKQPTSNPLSTPSISTNPSIESLASISQPSSVAATFSQQTPVSCPPLDVEWPPRALSGPSSHLVDGEKQSNAGPTSTSSIDDIDPFPDWPPRAGVTSSGLQSLTNGTIPQTPSTNNSSSSWFTSNANNSNSKTNGNNGWAFDMQGTFDLPKQSQGITTAGSLNSSLNSQSSSPGFLKQNQGTSSMGTYNNNASDLSSIFGSGAKGLTAPKLAPPPSSSVGGGRGRGRGTSRVSQAKPQSEQTSLLDLL